MINTIKKYVLLLCLTMSLFGYAQEDENNKKHLGVKLNITSMVDYTPSIQLSFEYALLKNLYLQHEGGYITHFISPFWNREDNLSGYKIKNLLKYYWNYDSKNTKYYSGLDITFKKIGYMQNDWFRMYDGSYAQQIRYPRNKTIYTANIIGGMELPVINDKWIIDIYAGIGFRYLILSETLPDNTDGKFNRHFFHKNPNEYKMPNLIIGLRMGYLFTY